MSADGELHSGPVVSGPESGPETGPETPVVESGPAESGPAESGPAESGPVEEEAPPVVADEAPHGAQEGAQAPHGAQEGAQAPHGAQEGACDHYSNPGDGVCPKCGYDAAGA